MGKVRGQVDAATPADFKDDEVIYYRANLMRMDKSVPATPGIEDIALPQHCANWSRKDLDPLSLLVGKHRSCGVLQIRIGDLPHDIFESQENAGMPKRYHKLLLEHVPTHVNAAHCEVRSYEVHNNAPMVIDDPPRGAKLKLRGILATLSKFVIEPNAN